MQTDEERIMSVATKSLDDIVYVIYRANSAIPSRVTDTEPHEWIVEDLAKIPTHIDEVQHGMLLNHWNHEPWFSKKTDVMGSGPHRLNQYDTDGFAWRQYRFAKIDDMIEFLCSTTHRMYRVTKEDSQYWARTHYMEGY
tara:strand:- start:978 stop:1394 length:417 start_codon:yes stop_codon:yes gene_type:complete